MLFQTGDALLSDLATAGVVVCNRWGGLKCWEHCDMKIAVLITLQNSKWQIMTLVQFGSNLVANVCSFLIVTELCFPVIEMG